MQSGLPPLLVTSAVRVSAPFVVLSDADRRIELTIHALAQWLAIAPDLTIVLCDGSNFDFSEIVRERFPAANIECLSFSNDARKVALYGKGFGEGEIVNYALEHSHILRDAEVFAKCTSKLWVGNFVKIMRHWNHEFQFELKIRHQLSIRRIVSTAFDSRFYIIKKELYVKHFLEAYRDVRDEEGYYLEHSFHDILINNGFSIYKGLFPIPPFVEGVSGTRANKYAPEAFTIKKRAKRFLMRWVWYLRERYMTHGKTGETA